MIKRFFSDESGATMVEYAIMVALIAVALIVVIGTLSSSIESAFQTVADKLDAMS